MIRYETVIFPGGCRVREPTAPEQRDELEPDFRGSSPLLDRGRVALRPIELSTEVVESAAGIRSLKHDYERLERASGNTLPFALHEWHLAWCEHLLNRHPQREEQLRLLALRNRSGDCVALVPLVRGRWRVGPLRFPMFGFLGNDEGITEVRGALIEPGYEELCVRCVYQSLCALPGWHWLHWPDASPSLAAVLTREFRPLWHEARVDCLLDLPPSWPEFRAGLTRNVRESLRHCYNSLRRDGHRFELDVARTPREVLEALPRFFELHGLRARMPWGPRHRNYFANPLLQQFLPQVCSSLAARDAVRVFQLRIAGTVVASRVGFVVGNSLYLYYSGFDPAWAAYSVMTTTEAEVFRYAIAAGIRTVNLSPTPIRSKLRWRPRLIELRSCVLHRETLTSRLACRAWSMVAASEALPARAVRHLLWTRLKWR
jgi:CelD/BcsL family acetyltransferase involved in cellulose biosynthesis